MTNTRQTGAWAEDVACRFLQSKGYIILERNFFSHFGEIDLIAKDNHTLVFVEVKYRKNLAYGTPGEAVGLVKQKRIRKTAMYYLTKNHLSDQQPMRFDVVEIVGKKIRVIDHAF